MPTGRDSKGRIKRGYKLTKSGVRKVGRKRATRRKRRRR